MYLFRSTAVGLSVSPLRWESVSSLNFCSACCFCFRVSVDDYSTSQHTCTLAVSVSRLEAMLINPPTQSYVSAAQRCNVSMTYVGMSGHV